MKTAIIVFPGTNREKDMAMAVRHVSGAIPDLVWHKETSLENYDLIILPGGFSYGDYLRCGAMAAHSPIMRDVVRMADRGVRLLAVCNGFQMLVETGMVPGGLLRNAGMKFICKQVHLRVESDDSDFTRRFSKGEIFQVPVAHGEGNYFVDDPTLRELQDSGQIAFRYCNADGDTTHADINPNGSINQIAGVFNKSRTVMGMMPHPEDAVLPHQGNQSGKKIFQSIVEALA